MTTEPLSQAILFALLAGATIPLGAALALWDKVHPNWMSGELRHGVIAFGGGVLVAAVALVLVPEGVDLMPGWMALPDPATLPDAPFEVDWVRSWRKQL